MAYIGREPQIGNFQICDAISTVNNQAAYTMQVSSVDVLPESANHMIVSLNGVIQKPNSSYTVSGATITFASNLVTGDVINFIQILGSVLDLGVPSDDTVTAAKLSTNAVTTAKILDANVTLAKLAGDSVNATKIADNAISEEHLDVTSITGHTAETSIADGDTILIHDASASALRKMTKANFVSGIGGTNTPAFSAYMSGNGQTINNNTFTKIDFDTENFDVGGCYDTSNNRFVVPSGQAGKYVIVAKSAVDGIDDTENCSIALYKNNSRDDKTYVSDYSPKANGIIFAQTNKVYDLSVGDYIEAFLYHNEGDARSAENTNSYFYGYKLIE